MSACNICNTEHSAPLYVSTEEVSITSLTETRAGRTEVCFCENCGHLQTVPLADLDNYYDEQYRILIDSEEEDQLYKIVNGEIVFRVAHQVDTFLKNVDLPQGARVLDFGCAKGASARLLLERRPDLEVCLFDVSQMYLPFWERFSAADRWATYDIPAHWNGQFDAVFSMYVAEHVADPVTFAREISALLKPNGTLYWLVPNVAANKADFIVADHVNHFSEHSMVKLMQEAGLTLRDVDCVSHEAGLIAIADRRPLASSFQPKNSLTCWTAEVRSIASYWSQLGTRIREFERQRPANERSAIYGSGFYGTFIASCLENPEKISCFLDQNPYRQGKEMMGRPIIDPRQMDASIHTVYVGLNPSSARKIIGDIKGWHNRDLELCFLNDDVNVRKAA
ncbi:MAG: class I SAM-dependent methyltransferase [Planctomycetaceae bacterium]